MAKAVIMPKFGFTQEESEIVAWLVEEGAVVEDGDPIAEVTTDKIDMEVEAPTGGILAGFRYQAGDVVPVTEVIAYILAPGESVPEEPDGGATEPGATAPAATAPAATASAADKRQPVTPSTSGSVTPVAARMAREQGVDLTQVQGSGSDGKIRRADIERYVQDRAVPTRQRATPAARRIARKANVVLADVDGTGPRGRVQAADVRALLTAREAEAIAGAVPESESATDGVTRVPLSRMRAAVGRNLQASWQQAPHITFRSTIDVAALQALVARANADVEEEGQRANITAALILALAWTLRRHPRLNCHLSDGALLQYDAVHVGVAVALPDGLIVPVIRDAHALGLRAIAAEIRRLATGARSGRLQPSDLQGATFSMSNLGMYGIDDFTAILNPPEVGILAVGTVRRELVPDAADVPVVRPRMTLALSVDHRAVDGADAARFMADLRAVIERPDRMLY